MLHAKSGPNLENLGSHRLSISRTTIYNISPQGSTKGQMVIKADRGHFLEPLRQEQDLHEDFLHHHGVRNSHRRW